MINLEGVFSPYDIYVITDAVYQRKLQAKTKIEDIEDGRIGPSDYEYWQRFIRLQEFIRSDEIFVSKESIILHQKLMKKYGAKIMLKDIRKESRRWRMWYGLIPELAGS